MRARVSAMTLLAAVLAGCDDKVCTPAGEYDGDGPPPGVTNGTCAPEEQLFTDHFSCNGIQGPCPSSDERGAKRRVAEDASRLGDPDLAWSTAQLTSCSCTCCHHDGGLSAHVWSWDFAPVWTDSLDTERLKTLAARPTDPHEDIAPADNNGFSRVESDIPSTDGVRMRAFLERELARRGAR